MNAHVEERLGAFLDEELASDERAEVTAHLRECGACARLLEELSAVDDAARSLTVEPPEGYFDTFATRLGSKLRRPARPRVALPVWTLAAAAALLLAVLTPMTLQRKETQPEAEGPSPGDLASRPTPQPPEAPAPATAGEVVMLDEGRSGKDARTEVERAASEGPSPKKQRAQREDKRVVHGEADLRPQAAAGVVQAPPPPPPAAQAPAPLTKSQPTPAPPGRRAAPHDRPEFAAEPPSLVLDEEDAAPSSTAVAKEERVDGPKAAARERQKTDGLAAGRTASAFRAEPQAGTEARYRTLLARRPSTAEEARVLREAWRAFEQSQPTGPRADEARVRVIEVGAQTFRLSGDEKDRATVEKDANAYLARPDAAQTERVRTIVTTLTR